MTIQERIRLKRNELEMSQDELAHRVGYKGRTAISKIENGECQIRQSMIEKLAKALNTTPSYLMGWDDEDDTDLFGEELLKAFYKADPVTQQNICLLLGVRIEERSCYLREA